MFRLKRTLPLILTVALLFLGISGASAKRWTATDMADTAIRLVNAPLATCTNSYTADGVPLDQCYGQTFTIGGNTRSVSIHYTLSSTHDGSPHNHWINAATEAEDVADWAQQAWERYYADSGIEPYFTGCDNNIDFLIRKGDGWAGIAYWASSSKCRIGIDAPMIRTGGGQRVTYHEVQHYQQYGYNACYAAWKPGYDGNAEFIEGYADYGPSTVGNFGWYDNNTYNPAVSMYNKGYGNRFVIYLSEQVSEGLGPNGSPGDAWYRSNGMYEHYRVCNTHSDLYVERNIVQANTHYSYEEFFMNFFAANWGKDWADVATQAELHYYEEDVGITLAAPTLTADVSMSGGTQNWAGHSTPDTWAGKYYQVRPQSGCPYLMLEVDGQAGANLGISLMAADTSAPSLVRSAWVGEDFVRTFAAHGVHNRLAAVVNAFGHNYAYDVTATCATPQIDILEPRQTNFALVGDPTSPIAFLARVRVTSGGDPVRGLVESSFTFDADGDAVTVVTDSLQEIGGGEYWTTLLPPVKPAGTTFVDFEACLDGAICDTELNALLYVAPGNSDIIILHDESGSMSTEDVVGEGTRLENAQKAAAVWANLAQIDDRYGVMGFNAKNNPSGCGLPGGDGDCELDIRTHMARTEITNPTSQIPTIEAAINATDALAWTPIGAGLRAAKNALQASPYSLNPKYIILLSDGEENVNPLYGDPTSGIQQEMIDSGVVVHTIGFSGDAPSALLSQIAADTGGIYRYVPASPGDSLLQSETTLTSTDVTATFVAQGVPEENAAALAQLLAPASTHYPSNLGLADVYDFFETEAQGAARIGHGMHVFIADNTWREQQVTVDASVNMLRLVSAGRQMDVEAGGGCEGYIRRVEVLAPDAGPREWVPVSPPTQDNPPPATWDIRNSYYVDVVMVPNPAPGLWKIRTKYYWQICRQNEPVPTIPQYLESDFLMNASVQSTYHLEGRFLDPYEDNQGLAGEHVPIVVALMQKTGTLPGAVVLALVEKPGSGFDYFWLRDDGNHGDGKANDGIYGFVYPKTTVAGSYDVTIAASFVDPSNPAQNLARGWYGSFYVQGDDVSQDDDPFPWWWERWYPCMDPHKYDNPQADYDNDGATNFVEWQYGTNPCDPDTDDGGEKDGSEIEADRNPHDPKDDKVPPIWNFSFRPLNKAILVRWSRPLSYTVMLLDVEGVGSTEMPPTGVFTYPLTNDTPYTVTLRGFTVDGEGAPTEPQVVTPKEDPDPPSGFIQINGGAPQAFSRNVVLHVNVSDELLDGLPSPGSAASIANDYTQSNVVSAGEQMRFTNDTGAGWSAWEPYAPEKPWTLDLDCAAGTWCVVYAQFKDAAENESLIVFDNILFKPAMVYLPLVLR